MKKYLMPHLARIVSSDLLLETGRFLNECKRRTQAQPHTVEVFLRINDPYSYLLLQVLPEIKNRYRIELKIHTVSYIDSEMFPEKEMWAKNAFSDAGQLAALYSLSFPSKKPTESQDEIDYYTNQLIMTETSANNLSVIETVFKQYWDRGGANQPETLSSCIQDSSGSTQALLSANEKRLKMLGHYMSGMIYYGGEWYWGIDRLDHLEKRANNMGLSTLAKPLVKYNKTYHNFCLQPPITSVTAPKPSRPLVLYFSIRSPYSHLGLEKAVILAKHYNIDLVVKPVLPMVMRGLSVPNAKKMYIFHDTKREAKKHGIDYGYVADPLGLGVERCYALFKYAESEGKAIDYLLAYARGVNALGIRSETDKGLQKILSACGLSWNIAKKLLADNASPTGSSWRTWAEQNLKEMYGYGLWGVPSFKYKNTAVWGQDRIFVIENEIQNDINERNRKKD